MTLDDDEEANRVTHNEMIQSRVNIQNNVITRRREQLKDWENSEMNRLPPTRKPVTRSKVKFQDSDIFFSACVSGDEEEVDDLLAKGANINTTTIDGVTPLHQAVIDGKFDMVRFLVERGAEINAQDNEGWTPLHAAVCCGHMNIVEYLVERGSDITVTNTDKELPLDLAEDDEIRIYIDEKLNQKGLCADECREREEKLMMKDCMEWIRAGAYLDKPHPRTGATALHVAASKGYNKLISGADIHARDYEGWTPLHAAAHWGEKEACRILMARGADIEEETVTGQNVLRVADSSIVESLERLQEEFSHHTKHISPIDDEDDLKSELSHEDGSVTVNATVLQPTGNQPNTPKRLSIVRMNSEEKNIVKKKDEHDENVSLHFQLPTHVTARPEPADHQHSLSPPPAKRPHETEQKASVEVEKPPTTASKPVPPPVPPKTSSYQAPLATNDDDVEDEEVEEEAVEEEAEVETESESQRSNVTPVTNTTLYLPKTYQVPGSNRVVQIADKSESSQSTPSVQAVLPAPRLPSGSSESSSLSTVNSSSFTSSSQQSQSTYSSSHSSRSLNDKDAIQQKPAIPVHRDGTPTPTGVRKVSSITSRSVSSPRQHESIEDEELSAQTASEASNTSASISSIQTRSRSMTPNDNSSSLHSSDQSVRYTIHVPAAASVNAAPSATAPSTNAQPSATPAASATAPPSRKASDTSAKSATPQPPPPSQSQTEQKNLTPLPKALWAQQPLKQAPLARISTSPSSDSLNSNSESSVMFRKPAVPPQASPLSSQLGKRQPVMPAKPTTPSATSIIQRLNSLTQPTIASATRQRPPMLRSQSVATEKEKAPSTNAVGPLPNPNAPPWVGHWKSEKGLIQIRSGAGNSVSGMIRAHEQQRAEEANEPTSSSAVSHPHPIQNSPAFRKSLQQTPPTLPAPQKESEAERKAKSRLQRASRRSTQGVTLEQLSEARGCGSNSSSATSTPTSSRQQNRPEDEHDVGRWKSNTLLQQHKFGVSAESAPTTTTTTTTTSTYPTFGLDSKVASPLLNSLSSTAVGQTPQPIRATVPNGQALSQLHASTPPNLPTETPSATKMRRSQLFRANRRGTGPVDMEQVSEPSAKSNTTSGLTTTLLSTPMRSGLRATHDDKPELPTFATTGAIPQDNRRQNGFRYNNAPDAEMDYKVLYEKQCAVNETLRREIESLKLQQGAPASAGQPGQAVPGALRRTFPRGAGTTALGTANSDSSSAVSTLSHASSTPSAAAPGLQPAGGSAGSSAFSNTSSSYSENGHDPAQRSGLSAVDAAERRQLERRVNELEYELQKMKQLQSDHKRLKDENNALIRVISKLSKDNSSSSSTSGSTRQPTSSVPLSVPSGLHSTT